MEAGDRQREQQQRGSVGARRLKRRQIGIDLPSQARMNARARELAKKLWKRI